MSQLRPRRRGISMVEIGIFMPIGLMVVGLAWTFFSQSAKTSKRADATLQGIQTNLLFSLQLERDLEGLYEDPNYPITIWPDGTRLTFYRCADIPPDPADFWPNLPVEVVEYMFHQPTGKVWRRVGADPNGKALHGYFESVFFWKNKPEVAIDASSPLPYSSTVSFFGVAMPEDEFRKPPIERDEFRTYNSTVFSAAARRWEAARFSYPFWNPIPYSPPDRP